MLFFGIDRKAEKSPPRRKAFHPGRARAAIGAALPAGIPRCANCGLPLLDARKSLHDARKALRRERRLVARLLDESETFKQSLSNEIYEAFDQQLVGAMLHFQSFEPTQRENPAEARRIFHAGLELLQNTLDEARRIANRLQPPVLDDFGLTACVNHLLGEMRREGGPAIEFLTRGDLDGISPPSKKAAYRIVQELLANACRHSGSLRVRLRMARRGRSLHIEIEDWGVGFDPAKVPEDRLGLRKIRKRAQRLGGRAVIHSAPGKGTRAVVALPLS
jgi:signal transduction histidine kinase